jgi:hypothetical protein
MRRGKGIDVEQLDSEIAADRQREAALGLSFGKSPPPAQGMHDALAT